VDRVWTIVRAPLAELLDYGAALAGETGGRGRHVIRFDRCLPCHTDPAAGEDDRAAPSMSPLRPAGPKRQHTAEAREPREDDSSA
jgi:hypothetical protein